MSTRDPSVGHNPRLQTTGLKLAQALQPDVKK